LRPAREFTSARQTSAVQIVQHGEILDEWGDTSQKINIRSIRKSLLGALYGVHVAEGAINLGRSLAELGIDDNSPSLTALEKQAAILDLLRSRSGVYHPALYEAAEMKAERPARHSHPPGAFWYYNNWDFNALGTIFEQLTGAAIFEEFGNRIAGPLGMQDFDLAACEYVTGADSIHPAYVFRMSARDLARFGQLYLNRGAWRGKPVVPADWVERSVSLYSSARHSAAYRVWQGYGLLWWVLDWGFCALGVGGHVLAVVPSRDLVVVHRVPDENGPAAVPYADVEHLVRMIADAV
jgi:CubicO group peptidase (beta-lactamase class C family)